MNRKNLDKKINNRSRLTSPLITFKMLAIALNFIFFK